MKSLEEDFRRADRVVRIHADQLLRRFPRYPQPATLVHGAQSHLANIMLLRHGAIPIMSEPRKAVSIKKTYCFSVEGVSYTIYETLEGQIFCVFCTVYHILYGYIFPDGSFQRVHPDEKVLGYEINVAAVRRWLAKRGEVSFLGRATGLIGFRQPQKTILMFGTIPNIGHHIWNEYSGLEFLEHHDLLKHVDEVWVGPYDYFNTKQVFSNRGIKTVRVASVEGVASRHILVRGSGLVFGDETRNLILRHVYAQSGPGLQGCGGLENSGRPVICIQLRQASRRWVSETASIARLIKETRRTYLDAIFIIDGFGRTKCGTEAEKKCISLDMKAFEAIASEVAGEAPLVCAINMDINDKVALLKHADIAVSPIGSGGVITHWLLQKPLISYGPVSYYSWTSSDSKAVVETPGSHLLFVPASKIDMHANGCDYDFNWKELRDLLFAWLHEAGFAREAAGSNVSARKTSRAWHLDEGASCE